MIDDYGGTAIHGAAYGTHVMTLKELMRHPDFEKAKAVVNKDRKTALDIAIDVYDAQEKKVELAPSHSELRMLLETGKGLDAPQTTTNRTKPKSISGAA